MRLAEKLMILALNTIVILLLLGWLIVKLCGPDLCGSRPGPGPGVPWGDVTVE